MPNSPIVLALDLGTSSCRSALFDSGAERIGVSFAQEPYPLRTDREGAAELDPADLVDGISRCITRTLKALPSGVTEVEAIGMSCFLHSMLGIDVTDQATTPVYTWADGRCAADAAALREMWDEADYHAATGCMLRPSFWPARLRWWHRTHSRQAARRIRQWWSPAEWVQAAFCGEPTMSISMASGTGLLDATTGAWHSSALDLVGLETGRLPRISDLPLKLTSAMARRFPALSGARWFPGIGDGAASNLGAGATRPGIAALNFGTSGALRIVVKSGKVPEVPNGLFHYRIDARRRLIGGAISNAGNARAWCLSQLALPLEPEALEAALVASPPLAHGLTVLPFFAPERSPSWNEAVPGLFLGIRQHTTALDLYAAVCEATYQRLATILDLLRPLTGRRVPKMMVGGGIQKSPALLQRLCDALGAAVYPSQEPEASLRGAAVYALEQLGIKPPDPLPGGPPLRPRPQYARAFARQRADLLSLENQFTPTASCPS